MVHYPAGSSHVCLWSDESKVNLFDSDWCPAWVAMPWWGVPRKLCRCMTTAGTGELWFIEGNMDSNMYCDILKPEMMPPPPSETVFQHNNNPKHTTKMTTALLLKVKVMEWPSMSPDLKPIKLMWGILKRKEEKQHVSNIQQLCDVIMEEWKRMPATTGAALVNYMARRIKAVLDNNGAPSKYWHFGHILTCSLRVYSFLLPVIWTIMVICWVIFRGQ